ncbi:hypothetical protein IGI04_037122 [Brassica rapa subsp. trilocularis]|uniref:BAH domain-containing protein n=1 Tax=Brassica rapa subsp. trilocularis TaxID=1813537 RepID=A0ABQ7LGF1_BRACM|nr:hypothetical protein IGI04_037122 [Brassica rapa subsp. trilocularis]
MACDEVVDELDENEDDMKKMTKNRQLGCWVSVSGTMKVFLGNNNVYDVENHELPRLVYFLVRPRFDHHEKAGAINSLVISGISIVPYRLKVDCYHYIYNSKTLRGEMCSVVASQSGKKICYVHYPQRFDGIGIHDIYSNSNVVFFNHLKVEPTDPKQGFLDFCYPPRQRDKELENEESEFRNSDLQLGLATLEKVFLNIAR